MQILFSCSHVVSNRMKDPSDAESISQTELTVTVNKLRDVRIELDNGIAIETHISNGRFNDAETEQWSFFRRHDHSSPYVTVYQTGIDIAEEW